MTRGAHVGTAEPLVSRIRRAARVKHCSRNGATLLTAAGLLLAGCSQPQDSSPPVVRPSADADPSAADMRAARLLSLSNNGALNPTSNPYQQAVACVDGIGAVAVQPAAASALNDQQKRMLAEAKGIYERKAMDAGQKTAAQVSHDVQVREAASDLRQRLLAGLSCLRQLG